MYVCMYAHHSYTLTNHMPYNYTHKYTIFTHQKHTYIHITHNTDYKHTDTSHTKQIHMYIHTNMHMYTTKRYAHSTH